MTPADPHIEALRNALVAEHEQRIAEVEAWADEAAASGDLKRQRWHLDHLDRWRAMPCPWEPRAA